MNTPLGNNDDSALVPSRGAPHANGASQAVRPLALPRSPYYKSFPVGSRVVWSETLIKRIPRTLRYAPAGMAKHYATIIESRESHNALSQAIVEHRILLDSGRTFWERDSDTIIIAP